MVWLFKYIPGLSFPDRVVRIEDVVGMRGKLSSSLKFEIDNDVISNNKYLFCAAPVRASVCRSECAPNAHGREWVEELIQARRPVNEVEWHEAGPD